MLSSKYGNHNPWNPHSPANKDPDVFLRELHVAALHHKDLGDGSRRRAALRAINVPQLQPARRRYLLESCIEPLLKFGIDAAIHTGCCGREIPLDLHKLEHGGVQKIWRNSTAYTIDTTLWKESWSQAELAEVERRQAQMDWFPLAWLNFPKDVMERQTPGFVGGHISHVELWKWAHDEDLDYVIVVEDDATPTCRYGLGWVQIWTIVASQVHILEEECVPWDILYIGRTPSYTPEGPSITPLIVTAGYCLRTHAYCLSRRGLSKLLKSQISSTVTHRPQDEVLATLILFSAGLQHPRADFHRMLWSLDPPTPWVALAFKGDGIASQLEDIENTARAKSDTAPATSSRSHVSFQKDKHDSPGNYDLASKPQWEQAASNIIFQAVD